jgi:hypothetical protein
LFVDLDSAWAQRLASCERKQTAYQIRAAPRGSKGIGDKIADLIRVDEQPPGDSQIQYDDTE